MPRPVTLFTGQFADIPLEQLAKKTHASPMQVEQLPPRRPLDCLEAPDRHVVEQGLRVRAPERPDP